MEKNQVFDREEINALKIKVGCAEVEILESADANQVTVAAERLAEGEYTCKVKDNCLKIKYKFEKNIHVNNCDTRITVTLPQGMVFEKVCMEIGAGTLNAQHLAVNGLLKAEVGAGKTRIGQLETRNAEIECGVGKFDMNGSVDGNLTVQCGVGSSDIQLTRKESDYDYAISCGLGHVEINNQRNGGIGSSKKTTNPGAVGLIKLDCGLGSIRLNTLI